MELQNPYDENDANKVSADPSPLAKARWYFGTGLNTVEKIRDKRCTWTVRGWKQVSSVIKLFSSSLTKRPDKL
jgi:hypothetical protein